MTVVHYEQPAPLPATTRADELDTGPTGRVARLRAAAEYASYIGGTNFVPEQIRGDNASITAAILYGEELGLEPLRALAWVVMIRGRAAMLAEGQRALVLARGHEIWVEESTVTRAIVAARRAGSDRVGRVTWTMDDAKRAGLAGQPAYRSYPREMLVARASAALVRQMFPDVLGGLAAAEELEGLPENGVLPPAEPAPPDDVQPAKTPSRTRRRAPAATHPPAAAEPPAAQPLPPTPPPDTQPEPPAEPDRTGEPPATDAQKRQIFALMRDVRLDDRQKRLDYTSAVVSRDVESSSDLTIGEASTLIEALNGLKDRQAKRGITTEDSPEEPAPFNEHQA